MCWEPRSSSPRLRGRFCRSRCFGLSSLGRRRASRVVERWFRLLRTIGCGVVSERVGLAVLTDCTHCMPTSAFAVMEAFELSPSVGSGLLPCQDVFSDDYWYTFSPVNVVGISIVVSIPTPLQTHLIGVQDHKVKIIEWSVDP